MEGVYVIEYREDTKGEGSVVASLQPTLEKAVEWMKKNDDFNPDDAWWWVVYPMPIGKDSFEDDRDDELYFFNKKVQSIYWQPNRGKKPIEYGDVMIFELTIKEYNYLEGHQFEGILTSTENRTLTFSDVYKVSESDEKVFFQNEFTFDLDDLYIAYKK